MRPNTLACTVASCLALALVSLPSSVLAADAGSDTAGDALRGEPIVVTGEGLAATPAAPAYNTQTITAEQLSRTASGRLDDALLNAAGVQQFRRADSRATNPSAQGITLRSLGGNATSRTLVLLDGVPMADPFFGYIPFSAIDPERLASVRVQRGGGSGAFGAGAVAGTVDMTSAGAAQLGLLNASGMVDEAQAGGPVVVLGAHAGGHPLAFRRGPEPLAAIPPAGQHGKALAQLGCERPRHRCLAAIVDHA